MLSFTYLSFSTTPNNQPHHTHYQKEKSTWSEILYPTWPNKTNNKPTQFWSNYFQEVEGDPSPHFVNLTQSFYYLSNTIWTQILVTQILSTFYVLYYYKTFFFKIFLKKFFSNSDDLAWHNSILVYLQYFCKFFQEKYVELVKTNLRSAALLEIVL